MGRCVSVLLLDGVCETEDPRLRNRNSGTKLSNYMSVTKRGDELILGELLSYTKREIKTLVVSQTM